MKKFLLVIALIILGLGLNAQSVEDQTTVGSLTFEVTSVSPAECEVSDCEESATDVTIPSSVEIEGTEFSVTSIGNDAFWNCSSLTSIICYAENVPETGSSAFDF